MCKIERGLSMKKVCFVVVMIFSITLALGASASSMSLFDKFDGFENNPFDKTWLYYKTCTISNDEVKVEFKFCTYGQSDKDYIFNDLFVTLYSSNGVRIGAPNTIKFYIDGKYYVFEETGDHRISLITTLGSVAKEMLDKLAIGDPVWVEILYGIDNIKTQFKIENLKTELSDVFKWRDNLIAAKVWDDLPEADNLIEMSNSKAYIMTD